MPFALITIALMLIVAGAKGTYGKLKDLLVSDFTGSGNFLYWIVAIGTVGAVGYIPGAEKFSRAFLVLILVAIVLSHRGFFNQFNSALAELGSASNAGQQ